MDISYQLYSSRDGGAWTDTIAMLAAAGYTQVEGFGGVYDDPGAFRALLDQHGLTMPSAHFFPLDTFENHFEDTLQTARTLGTKRLFCPAPTDSYREGATHESWAELAHRLETIAKKVQDKGLRFGWHNHHWEFMPLANGVRPMQILLDHSPSIEWEVDVAWIVRGNADPMAWIAERGDRITTAHIKDIAPEGECTDEDGWADVGFGTMDWPAIMAALRAQGVDLFVMEHDNPSDAARFAQRSIASFKEY